MHWPVYLKYDLCFTILFAIYLLELVKKLFFVSFDLLNVKDLKYEQQ